MTSAAPAGPLASGDEKQAPSSSLPRPAGNDHTTAGWFEEAVGAVGALARHVVPGCHKACVDVLGEDDGHPLEDGHDLWSGEADLVWIHGATLCIALRSGPMDEHGDLLGVLSLTTDSGTFGPDAAEPARLVARLASAVVAGRQATLLREDHLQEALRSRDIIGQAKGVLMVQSNVDADTAFKMLVRASQRENRKLRDLAGDLVERAARSGPTAAPPEGSDARSRQATPTR